MEGLDDLLSPRLPESAGKCQIRFDNVLPLLFANGFNADMSVSGSPHSVI